MTNELREALKQVKLNEAVNPTKPCCTEDTDATTGGDAAASRLAPPPDKPKLPSKPVNEAETPDEEDEDLEESDDKHFMNTGYEQAHRDTPEPKKRINTQEESVTVTKANLIIEATRKDSLHEDSPFTEFPENPDSPVKSKSDKGTNKALASAPKATNAKAGTENPESPVKAEADKGTNTALAEKPKAKNEKPGRENPSSPVKSKSDKGTNKELASAPSVPGPPSYPSEKGSSSPVQKLASIVESTMGKHYGNEDEE